MILKANAPFRGDGQKHPTSFTYNELGMMTTMTTPGDATINSLQVTYMYDRVGLLRTETTDANKVIDYDYDNRGNLLSTTTYKLNGLSKEDILTSVISYDLNNNVKKTTDSFTNVIQYT